MEAVNPVDTPLNIYIAATRDQDINFGFRAGIGIYFGNNSPHNISEPLPGTLIQDEVDLRLARRAISIARHVNRLNLIIHTDSLFLIIVGSQWIPEDRAIAHNPHTESVLQEYSSLLAEAVNMFMEWREVVDPTADLRFQRAVQVAEVGKNQCPWHGVD